MLLRLREIPLSLEEEESLLPAKVAASVGLPVTAIEDWQISRKGIDARRKPQVLRVYTVDFRVAKAADVWAQNQTNQKLSVVPEVKPLPRFRLQRRPRVVVIGTGPAGLFAALQLAENGARVTLLERGRPVEERLQDVRDFWQQRHFNPESNIQFGEGGAGTFSDGKLTSRLNDPLMRHVLQGLVRFGAPQEILQQAKPHVGSDRLRAVLVRFRQHLLQLGVEIHFSTRVSRLESHAANEWQVIGNETESFAAEQVVLAIGHSARDTYAMLEAAGVAMEAKPFAIGLRVEHPLELINRIQYGRESHPLLPAAEYSLAWNNRQSGRGTYSFCMCPGGVVVNAASETGGIVVNGMSDYQRAAEHSNSALVVAVRPTDFGGTDPLAGVRFQRHWEQAAFAAGGANWSAPAQPLLEFLQGSGGRLHSSCQPQVRHADLRQCLPDFVVRELLQALPQFNQRLRGFVSAEATLIGVETRTSAPVRILRGPDFESINHPGLFPTGEGAGYAGGIMSAAVDGLKVANRILENYAT